MSFNKGNTQNKQIFLPWHALLNQLVLPCVQTDQMSSKEAIVSAIQHTSQVGSPSHGPADSSYMP